MSHVGVVKAAPRQPRMPTWHMPQPAHGPDESSLVSCRSQGPGHNDRSLKERAMNVITSLPLITAGVAVLR